LKQFSISKLEEITNYIKDNDSKQTNLPLFRRRIDNFVEILKGTGMTGFVFGADYNPSMTMSTQY